MDYSALQKADAAVFGTLQKELQRLQDVIGLIASENLVTEAVLQASGSEMTCKYAEGYPGKRYYGGCECVDEVETLAIDRAKELFGAAHANVQPHSGTQANLAVVFSALDMGDTILSMNLNHGGHLSHGHHMNFVGKYFNIVPYGVEEESGLLDYDKIEQLAHECKPKLMIAGASAYSRTIDFERFGAIAQSVGALLLADIAHIAGLVAVGLHPSPVQFADFVTTTTHKTLRGPRGGMILCKEMHAKKIDSTLFPGSQGGPMMHAIAAKAVCFGEALQPGFKVYQQQVIDNASLLSECLQGFGYKVVSGGTDNHLFLLDLSDKNMTGKVAEKRLGKNNIVLNKNLVPFDQQTAFKTSGIRIGTPMTTSRGMGSEEMQAIAGMIHQTLSTPKEDEQGHAAIAENATELSRVFPIHAQL